MANKRAWVIHTPTQIADAIEKNGLVAIGWKAMSDFSNLATREQIWQKYSEVYQDSTSRKAKIGASILNRFANEIKEGDFALVPLKLTREVLIGEITGDYIFAPEKVSAEYPNVRQVKWLTKIARDDLSVPFRNTIGGLSTVFNADSHLKELEALLSGKPLRPVEDGDGEAEPDFYEEVKAKANDLIVDLISQIDPYEFQELVAAILRAMGFKTRVSTPGPDGGKDIRAYTDHFGFQGPRIIVQVKHRKGPANQAEVQQLVGITGGKYGLFVSTGDFTQQAIREAEKHSNIELINREQLVGLLLEYYERVEPQYQALIPLRKVYIPANPPAQRR